MSYIKCYVRTSAGTKLNIFGYKGEYFFECWVEIKIAFKFNELIKLGKQ